MTEAIHRKRNNAPGHAVRTSWARSCTHSHEWEAACRWLDCKRSQMKILKGKIGVMHQPSPLMKDLRVSRGFAVLCGDDPEEQGFSCCSAAEGQSAWKRDSGASGGFKTPPVTWDYAPAWSHPLGGELGVCFKTFVIQKIDSSVICGLSTCLKQRVADIWGADVLSSVDVA